MYILYFLGKFFSSVWTTVLFRLHPSAFCRLSLLGNVYLIVFAYGGKHLPLRVCTSTYEKNCRSHEFTSLFSWRPHSPNKRETKEIRSETSRPELLFYSTIPEWAIKCQLLWELRSSLENGSCLLGTTTTTTTTGSIRMYACMHIHGQNGPLVTRSAPSRMR